MRYNGNGGGTLRSGPLTLTLTLLALWACAWVPGAAGQTNNTVDDVTHTIHWGALAPDKEYKTTSYVADDGGLDPYYNLAVSFIGSCLPAELPIATVKEILEGKASIKDKWQPLAKDFVGFAICLVIGILFIIIFPIVACCFCCCRLCGNCGGKREQDPKDANNGCKRVVFSVILAVLAIFVIAGAACTFVSSNQFTKNLEGLNTSFSSAVDDANTFIDNIDAQFNRLGTQNFEFLTDTVADYVDGAKSTLAGDIIAAINKMVGLEQPLDALSQRRSDALTYIATLDTQANKLKTQQTTAHANLNTQNSACSSCLSFQVNEMNSVYKPAIDNIVTETGNFKNQVSTDIFNAMKTKLSGAIETEVNKSTQNLNVRTELKKIQTDQIEPLLSRIGDLKSSLNKETGNYQDKVGDAVNFIQRYDKYRWYAGLGLACFLVLIGVMLLLGVVLGLFCGSVKHSPTERGPASNCGGIFVMAAVGLIFIFGALLMLLTTLMYVFGAPTERYVCQSIDHLERIEQYTKTMDIGIMDLSNISFNLQGQTIYVSVSALMNDCKNGATLYRSLKLQSIVNSSLAKIEEYKNNTLKNLESINASQAASEANGKVNVSAEITTLKDTSSSLTSLKSLIETLKKNLSDSRKAAEGNNAGAGREYDGMITTCDEMIATCTSLKAVTDDIANQAGNLQTKVDDAIVKLNDQTITSNLVKSVMSNFTGIVFGFVDSYISDITLKLDEDIGKCSPFYSIVHAILSEAVCHGIVDPLNGFWLALGWCIFFFMPSLIFGVKVAKHYRIMTSVEPYSPPGEKGHYPPPFEMTSAPPTGNNKVGPAPF